MAGRLPTASVPLPTWVSQEASSGDATAKNTGSMTRSEKGAPGWKGQYHAWALSVHPTVTQLVTSPSPCHPKREALQTWYGLVWPDVLSTRPATWQGRPAGGRKCHLALGLYTFFPQCLLALPGDLQLRQDQGQRAWPQNIFVLFLWQQTQFFPLKVVTRKLLFCLVWFLSQGLSG